MKKYRVRLSYTCYTDFEIEAESEEEALDRAERKGPVHLQDPERWSEADMIEEIKEE